MCNWVKCNTNGAARGAPDLEACGGIFRDRSVAYVGCFVANLGVNYALHAELIGVMLANELAFKKGWHNLWFDCDLQLVIQAFKSLNIVPWKLQNRWKNCLQVNKGMCFGY